MQITKHVVASIDYILKNDAGEVIDASGEGEPMPYVHGVGGLIPGLERELEGRRAGDALEVRIAPEDGYGERDDQLMQQISREALPGDEAIEVGMQFQAQSDAGVHVVTVVSVDGDQVTLDANHPLAGETLNFEVRVIEVRQATAEEIEHGHVHGPGGHEH